MAISFLPQNNYPEDLVTKSMAVLNNSLLESKLRIRKTKPPKLYSMCLVCIPAYFHPGLKGYFAPCEVCDKAHGENVFYLLITHGTIHKYEDCSILNNSLKHFLSVRNHTVFRPSDPS